MLTVLGNELISALEKSNEIIGFERATLFLSEHVPGTNFVEDPEAASNLRELDAQIRINGELIARLKAGEVP